MITSGTTKRARHRRKCELCLKEFSGLKTQKYCSVSCQKRAAYQRKHGYQALKMRECKKCLKQFQPLRRRHVFCSDQCRRLYHLHGHPGYNILRDRLFAELEPRLAKIESILRDVLVAISPDGFRTLEKLRHITL
jgi:hypothetical protein